MSDRPAPRLRVADRQQVIPAMPLDNLLDTDHQARVVWSFCQGLDLTALYDRIRSRERRRRPGTRQIRCLGDPERNRPSEVPWR